MVLIRMIFRLRDLPNRKERNKGEGLPLYQVIIHTQIGNHSHVAGADTIRVTVNLTRMLICLIEKEMAQT